MQQNSQFETLSGQLTTQERRHMLASIRKSMEAEAAPIVPEIDPPPPQPEVQMQTLGLWQRMRLFLAQIFTGRSKEDVMQDWVMRSLQERLAKSGIDGIDAKTRQFKEAFARDVDELRRAALTLFPVVEIASRRRTELVLALAMHNFPGIHRELVRKTGEEHVRSIDETSERYLKRQLNGMLDNMLADIPTTSRGAVKSAMEQADTLYRLASFPFGGVLGSFEGAGQETGRHCAFDYVIRNVETLDGTLAALTRPVDLALLEALVLLSPRPADAGSEAGDTTETNQGAAGAADIEPDEEAFQQQIRDGLRELTAALGRFRTFAGEYPLTLIIRIVKEDPWWMPRVEHSGEDWSVLYRSFFNDRIHRVVLRVSMESQIKKHLVTLGENVGSVPTAIAGLPGSDSDVSSRAWYRGVALKTLGGTLWQTVIPRLKIVLTSGEFYKSSNRAQFNDAYNEFEQIPGRVDEFEEHLSPEGSWGSVLSAVSAGPVAERRGIAARADQELVRLADAAHSTVEMLVNVLGGILYARPGSSYDTLANYGQIGGRRNAEFIDELKETHANLQGWLTVYGELRTLETRAVENEIVLNTNLSRRGE